MNQLLFFKPKSPKLADLYHCKIKTFESVNLSCGRF